MKLLSKYATEFLALLFAVLLLNVWYLSGLAVEEKIIPKNYELLMRLVITVSGAFIGAAFAFKLNSRKEEEKERNRKIVAINSALTVLLHKIVILAPLKAELKKFENDPLRLINLPSDYFKDMSDLKIEDSEIIFLLEHDPSLLLNLKLVADNFQAAIGMVNKRTEFLDKEIRPKVNNSNIDIIAKADRETLEQCFGKREILSLEKFTNVVYGNVNSVFSDLNSLSDQLIKLGKEIFPGERFVTFDANKIIR